MQRQAPNGIDSDVATVTVMVLGTIHESHYVADGYSHDHLRALLKAFSPDLWRWRSVPRIGNTRALHAPDERLASACPLGD